MTQPITTDQIEELLEHEVPCGGINQKQIARSCGRSAVLRKHSHGHPDNAASFKCLSCWQRWYQFQAKRLARDGFLRCMHCGVCFTSVESFSDYRPF